MVIIFLLYDTQPLKENFKEIDFVILLHTSFCCSQDDFLGPKEKCFIVLLLFFYENPTVSAGITIPQGEGKVALQDFQTEEEQTG